MRNIFRASERLPLLCFSLPHPQPPFGWLDSLQRWMTRRSKRLFERLKGQYGRLNNFTKRTFRKGHDLISSTIPRRFLPLFAQGESMITGDVFYHLPKHRPRHLPFPITSHGESRVKVLNHPYSVKTLNDKDFIISIASGF